MAGKASFTPAFDAFRFYADGTESGSSPYGGAAQDANVTVNAASGNQQIHLRVRVQETGGAAGATTDDWGLEYQVNGTGGWTAITAASSRLQADTGSSLTDGAASTNRATNGISDGTGSFVAGEQEEANGVIEDSQLTASNFTEHVWALLVVAADNTNADTLGFRITLNGGSPGMTNSVTPLITISKPVALLADDVQSTSEVSAPVVGQIHVLLANDVESASEVSAPVLAETDALLANDIESASEVSAPVVGQIHALLADDVESASEVTAPVVGQVHVLLADDVESASEVTAPAVGQEHVLLADDVESSSEVSSPAASESNILLADDVESASEVSAPVIGQVHALLADDAESSSEVSAPVVGQVHVLLANDVESTSELSLPTLAESTGVDALLADDIESASEVTAPAIGQVHALNSTSIESASELSLPTLAEPSTGRSRVNRVYLTDSIIRQDDELILKIIGEFLDKQGRMVFVEGAPGHESLFESSRTTEKGAP